MAVLPPVYAGRIVTKAMRGGNPRFIIPDLIVRGAGHDDGKHVAAEAGNEVAVAHDLA